MDGRANLRSQILEDTDLTAVYPANYNPQLQALTGLLEITRLSSEKPKPSTLSSKAVRVTVPVFQRPSWARPCLQYGQVVNVASPVLRASPELVVELPAEQPHRVPDRRSSQFYLDPRICLAFPDMKLFEDPVSHVEAGVTGPNGRWYVVTRGSQVGVFNNWLVLFMLSFLT